MRRGPSWRRVAALLALVLIAVTAAGAYFYVKSRQEVLADRFRNYLTRRLSEMFDLQVTIGTVEGDPRGTVALKDVRVSVPKADGTPLDVFTCGEVRFRYTLLDFFRENFTSWFDVILDRPVFYANVPFTAPAAPEARSFELFSGFAQKVRSTARLIIKDGTIAWLGKEGTLSGIDGTIADRSFDMTVTLNHLKLGNFDTTTTLRVDGQLAGDDVSRPLRLTGSAATLGTVINWKPVPSESKLHFELNRNELRIWDSEVLGGIGIEGTVGHTSRSDIDLMLTAKGYPLKQMHEIMSFSGGTAVGGRLSGRLRVRGALAEPALAGEFAIEDNLVEGARFRAMQLFFEGIFPEVKISRSQMILSNGNPMQFASDQEINIRELFNSSTYERLIARSEQRTVTWKNWTLYREGDKDTVLLEHPLLPAAPAAPSGDGSLSEGEDADDETGEDAPVLDALFGGRESIKMELKDDEQMFTLQRKAQF